MFAPRAYCPAIRRATLRRGRQQEGIFGRGRSASLQWRHLVAAVGGVKDNSRPSKPGLRQGARKLPLENFATEELCHLSL